MAYVELPIQLQYEDANGNPAVGYYMLFRIYNTTTPATIYTNSSGSASATGFVLNSAGCPSLSSTKVDLYGDTTQAAGYKYRVCYTNDWNDVYIDYPGPFFPVISQATLDALTASDIGFADPYGSNDKTLDEIILSYMVPLLWFIPDEHHADIAAGTSTTNLATYFANAMNSSAKGIYAKAGTYQIASGITLASNKRFYGDGIDLTIFRMPQSNQTLNYNMLDGGSNDLSNFMLQDLTLKGSLDYQTSAATSGLVGFAVYSRGAVNNVHFIRTKITKFGDQVNYSGGGGGGGIVLGHPTTSATSGKASSNISAQFCVFDTNSNVPGFYLSQGGTGGTKNVKLIGNHFTGGYSSGNAQNCIYILGADATRIIEDLVINGNTFDISTNIDQAIELNWVRTFAINGNPFVCQSGVTACSGHILLRDGCIGGTVSGNPMRDLSGNAVAGVSLVEFASPGTGTIEDVTIDSNTIYGFDAGIQIDSGSAYGTANDNAIRACGIGFKLAACSDFEVSHNKITACGYAATFAGGAAGMRRIKFHHNDSFFCTTVPYTGVSAGEDIEGLEFEDNVDSTSAGTYMFDINMAAGTSNRFVNNRSGLTPLNPSHLGDWATIKLADTGPITIADGTTGPNVRSGVEYVCAATAGTVISSLVGTGYVGQIVTIRLAVNWTVDFTGTTLKGNGGVDLAGTASNGIRAQWNGTNWLCEVIGA